MSALVISTFNGKPVFHIDHICLESKEPKLRTPVATIRLTEDEAQLSVDALKYRWARDQLLHQKLGTPLGLQ